MKQKVVRASRKASPRVRSMSARARVPQWTEEVYTPGVGQDHLGLQSVSSDRILPQLVPAINVQTHHPRYWSFYSFVLDEFWRRDLPRSKSSWVKFYRPAECIFAVGAHLCDRPEHEGMRNVVGALAVRRLLKASPKAFDPRYNYYKAALGGFDLYGSGLGEMGLVVSGVPGVDVATEVITLEGKKIAASYRAAISETQYYREYFGRSDRRVPREVVLDFIRLGCLCQLRRKSSADRAPLTKLFLTAGDGADARRNTLRLVLDVLSQAPQAIDEGDFRQLIYFRKSEAAQYVPHKDLVVTARRWRLYQAREYYAFALERLWAYLANWGLQETDAGRRPLSEREVLAHLRSALGAGRDAELGLPTEELRARGSSQRLRERLRKLARVRQDLDGQWGRTSLDEYRLYRFGRTEEGRAVYRRCSRCYS